MTTPGASRSKLIAVFFVTVIVWLVFSLVQTTVILWNNTQPCGSVENMQSFEPSSLTSSKSSRRQKNSPLRYPPGRQYSVPGVKPDLGKHRPNADAVFSMATGYDIDDHLITIGSLLDTNYTGDIVLGVQPLKECSEQLMAFLEYHAAHSNLVVYAIPPCERIVPDVFKHLRCSMKYAYVNPFYENKPVSRTTNRLTGKDLAGRHLSPRKFRVSENVCYVTAATLHGCLRLFWAQQYEHYWIWQRNYNPQSRILLTDFRDLVFQANPMDHWTLRQTLPTTLHFFEESNLRRITETDRFTGGMIRDFFGPGMVEVIGNQTVICSGVTMGGKTAIEQYLLKMIWHMDNIQGEAT